MAKQNLKQEPDVAEIGLIYSEESISDVSVHNETVVSEIEPTLHDKHRDLINKANSGYLTGYQHSDLVAMAHWIEKKLNRGIAVNFQCPVCLIDLVQMFGRMEEK